jgi:Cft2 family RNA processing exonuclease
LEFDLLPEMRGLYKFDNSEPEIDAVLLSHSHTDHCAYISFLNRKITVYCGETTALITKAFAEITPKSFGNDFEGLDFRSFRTGDKVKVGSIHLANCKGNARRSNDFRKKPESKTPLMIVIIFSVPASLEKAISLNSPRTVVAP